MATKKNEVQVTESKELMQYGIGGVDLAGILAEEMDGLTPSFDRIKIPAGGGISYEIPGDNPESPDTVKEFQSGYFVPPSDPLFLQRKVYRRQQSSRLRKHGWTHRNRYGNGRG